MTVEPSLVEAGVHKRVLTTDTKSNAKSEEFTAQAIVGEAAIAAFFDDTSGLQPLTVFQSPLWLRETYQNLAQPSAASPYLVAVRKAQDGQTVLLLPLAVARQGRETVIGFPDFGVADYGYLIAGPGWCEEGTDVEQLTAAILSALPKVDRLSLTSVPCRSTAGAAVLSALGCNLQSRHSGHIVTIPDTVESFFTRTRKKISQGS